MWILPDAWPVNNLIAVLVSGTAIKFIVIKKLRTAVPYLILLWFFFIFRQFAILLHF